MRRLNPKRQYAQGGGADQRHGSGQQVNGELAHFAVNEIVDDAKEYEVAQLFHDVASALAFLAGARA